MSAALISLAASAGAPLIRQILQRKLGTGSSDLVMAVIDQIAGRAGVKVEEVEDLIKREPEVVLEAMEQTERMAPELIALYAAGLENQFALLSAESKGPVWISAWRPLWMYFLMFLWFWNIVVLHLLNALAKWALPPMDMTTLLSLTGLFMALYMGGHTIKDFAKSASKAKSHGP